MAAIATIQQKLPKGSKTKFEFVELDLSDLKIVKKCAETIKAKYPKIDILLNNAGMTIEEKYFTA